MPVPAGDPQPDFLTVDQVRAHLNDPNADETKLAGYIAAAKTVVAKRCPSAVEPAAEAVWDKAVIRGMECLILPRPMQSIVSVVAYSGGVATAYSELDITAVAPAYGYRYEAGPGLLYLSPMPVGSTVRVTHLPGLASDAQETVRLAALKLIQWWWQPAQYGAMTDDGPLAREGGEGTGAMEIAGYLVPRAVAQMLDAACPRDVGVA